MFILDKTDVIFYFLIKLPTSYLVLCNHYNITMSLSLCVVSQSLRFHSPKLLTIDTSASIQQCRSALLSLGLAVLSLTD